MKSISISIISISLFLFGCNTELDQPVSSCELSALSNESAKTQLYQDIIDAHVARGLPGLSVAIETPEDGLWLGVSGMAQLENRIEMEPCHLHHSASIAKSFISTMILKLSEQGQLKLDDPAKNYLPAEMTTRIDNLESATIVQLLNHTSGIYNFDDNMKVYVDTFNDPLVNPSSKTLFEKYVYDVPAYFAPGEGFHYSNTNYSLLGMIVEKLSGKTLDAFMKAEIALPLGLSTTSFNSAPEENIVNSYFEHFPGELQNCNDIQRHFTSIAKGHEGMLAAPVDYGRYMRALIKGQLLNDENTQRLLEFETRPGEDENYGLGLKRYITDYETGYGHTGGSIGTMSYAIYFPESDVSFSISCNQGTVFSSANTVRFYEDVKDELLKVVFEN